MGHSAFFALRGSANPTPSLSELTYTARVQHSTFGGDIGGRDREIYGLITNCDSVSSDGEVGHNLGINLGSGKKGKT